MITSKIKIPEEELVASLKRNERAAFDYLYDNYSAALYGLISKIIKVEEDAENVMQDSFIKIWRKIGDYDPSKGRLFTWMVNIARNTSIDLIRKNKNVYKEDIDTSITKVDGMMSFQPETSTIDLRDLMENLKPERRELLELVYLQGYTQEDAAEHLKIPLGTAKSRIRTALQDLKSYFAI